MNVEQLARHYDRLTPRERIPLLVAAAAREDEVEQTRLAHSARRVEYRVPEYWPLAHGWFDLVQHYLLQQVELAAAYWRDVALLQLAPVLHDTSPEAAAAEQEVLQNLRFTAYRCLVLAEAWQLFCADWQLHPEVLPRLLPGFETMELVLKLARPVAYSAEEALAYLRKIHVSRAAPEDGESVSSARYCVETATDIARALQEYLHSRV